MTALRLTLGLLLLLGSAEAAEGEPVVRIDGGSAMEILPSQDGQPRLRVRNDLQLRVRLHPRWRLFAAGNLRFGRSLAGDALNDDAMIWAGQGLDEADLYRLGIGYRSPDLSITAGRFVRVAYGGFYRLDGAEFQLGGHDKPVGLDLWAGRVGHPEPLTPVSAVGAGVEGRFFPRGAHGGWSGVAIRVGYDLHKSLPGLRHRWHAGASARSGAGHSISGGVQVGLLPPEEDEELELGLIATFDGVLVPHQRVRIVGGFRWEDLPPPGIPESSVTAIEILLPRGYAVGIAAVELHPDHVAVRIEGGPTVHPAEEGPPDVGGNAKVTAELPLGAAHLGLFGAAMKVSDSSFAGGGAGLSGVLGPLHLSGDVGAYSFIGLDGKPAPVAEGRFQAELLLPLPRRVGPLGGELKILGRVAGGADRLLVPWVRAGFALRGSLGIHRRSTP